MKKFEEPQNRGKWKIKCSVMADSRNYLDIPPLMRDYIVQYQLN